MGGRRRRRPSYSPSGPSRTPALIYILLAAVLFGSIFYIKQNMIRSVSGNVIDDYTGQPVANAVVTLKNDPKLAHTASINPESNVKTDADGRFVFSQVTENFSLNVDAINYRPNYQPNLEKVSSTTVRMVPYLLKGIIKDAKGSPVSHATVILGDRIVLTGTEGDYQFPDAPDKGKLVVKATGYRRSSVSFDKTMRQDLEIKAFRSKGIYLSAPALSDKELLPNLLKLVDTTELNTMVVDIKDETGQVLYNSKLPLAKSAPESKGRIADLTEFVKNLHAHNVYAVGRLAVFLDPVLTDEKPEWALKSRTTGKLWSDSANYNWCNPYSQEVWEYNLNLAKEAADAGFDEIQFDYVRFPALGNLSDIDYGRPSDNKSRNEAVSSFLKRAREVLNPYGVYTSINIFGLATLQPDDLGVGTRLDSLGEFVDYISPTLYPSSWGKGTFGFEQPALRPFDVIHNTLISAKVVMQGKTGFLRPWLQDFSLDGINYGQKEVREEIRAADQSDAATNGGWLLWNASGRYTASALNPKTSTEVGSLQSDRLPHLS